MSYCRGDVYCYGTRVPGLNGENYPMWVIHISNLLDSPFSKASFHLDSLEDLLKKFLDLKKAGIPVPQSAIDRVREEIKEDSE
jgi:hypothetical protein